MATDNKGVMVYLPSELVEVLERYCIDNNITRKNKDGVSTPSMGTAIIHYLKSKLLTTESAHITSTGLSKNDVLNLIREHIASSAATDSLTIDRVTEIARDEIEKALTPVNEDLVNIHTQLAKPRTLAQDDLDPGVVQTYLARRSEKMAAEAEAIRASIPTNSK
jgi:hypothetical protein